MNDHKTVYIYPARHNGKSITCLKRIVDLMDAGYNVVPVYRTPQQKLQGRRFEPIIVDKDILRPDQLTRAECMLNKILKGE